MVQELTLFLMHLFPALLVGWRCHLVGRTYITGDPIKAYHVYLKGDPTSLTRHGAADQEREDHHAGWTVHLSVMPRDLVLPVASLHAY